MALAIVGERRYDGRDAMGEEGAETLAVGGIDIANITKVDDLGDTVNSHGHGLPAVGMKDVHVGTGESHGIDAMRLETRNKLLVDQTTIDHRHHTQHRFVGDATAIHHLALYAEGGGYAGGAATTAMHQHLVAANG